MIKLENFCPKIRNGIILPEGDKIIYEVENPSAQLVLPVEAVDFILLCDGKNKLADIVEKLYIKQGSVQFKLIYHTLLSLQESSFLENGFEIDKALEQGLNSELNFLTLLPVRYYELKNRVKISKHSTFVFYTLALFIISFYVFALPDMQAHWFTNDFLYADGSFLKGIVFSLIASSVLITLKNILRFFLLTALTGKTFNLNITFHWFVAYFSVSSDSLKLVTNQLYVVLFHLAMAFCYVPLIYLIRELTLNYVDINQLTSIALLLFLISLNPYQESEFLNMLSSFLKDDLYNKIVKFKQGLSFEALYMSKKNQPSQFIYIIYVGYATAWSLSICYMCLTSLAFYHKTLLIHFKTTSAVDLFAALISVSFVTTLLIISSINVTRLYKNIFISKVKNKLLSYFIKPQFVKVESLDKVNLIKEIERLPLFNFLSLDMLENLVSHSSLKTYEDKTKIITQGDSNEEIFVLLSGRLVVEKIINNTSIKMGEILPISIFGEQAIIENTVRGATVTALAKSNVLCIPAPLLRDLAKQSQYIRAVENFQNAIIVSQFFSSAPFFRDLSAQIVHLFTVKGKIETFKKNQIIFQKGDVGDAFYLILRGSVGAVIYKNHIIPVSQGGFFGEISMFANTPRTATMFAREYTQVLKIGKNAFWDILTQDMNIALYIESVGEARAHEDLVLLAEDTPKSA